MRAGGEWKGRGRGRRPPNPRRGLWGEGEVAGFFAESGGKGVHGVTASAEGGGGVGGSGRKAAEDEEAVGGEFAGVFGGRVVAGREGERDGLDEAGEGFGLEAVEEGFFARGDEAADGDGAAAGPVEDGFDGRGVFFGGFPHGEAYVFEEGGGKEGGVAHGIPAAGEVENRMADVGEADETVGVTGLPEGTGRVEADVAADGGELAGVEGEFDVGVAIPAGNAGRRRERDGGRCPPNPLGRGGEGEVAAVEAGAGSGFGEEGGGFGAGEGGSGTGGPRAFPGGFGGIHEAVGSPEGAERGVGGVVHDEEGVYVVGHDDEIGDGDARERCVHRGQQGFDGFAAWEEGRAVAFINQTGQNLFPALQGEREEEELATGVVELHFHGGPVEGVFSGEYGRKDSWGMGWNQVGRGGRTLHEQGAKR